MSIGDHNFCTVNNHEYKSTYTQPKNHQRGTCADNYCEKNISSMNY